MEYKNYRLLKLAALLALLVITTTIFVIAFTFAGSSQSPDAIVTYTQNSLSWNITPDASGVAQLKIFGEAQAGEPYPLIEPDSAGKYYLRLKNDVIGNIGYNIFFYTDSSNEVPVVFDIPGENSSSALNPVELNGKQLISSFAGTVNGKNMKNFEINWRWNSSSDFDDTQIGKASALSDVNFTVNVLIIIEDNNTYSSGSASSDARMLHKKYISGYTDSTFKPVNDMSRAEVSAIFARILSDFNEANLLEKSTSFSDVSSADWCAKYISRLEKSKIINGYEDGSFKPDSSISRAEFAAICVRFYEGRAGKIKNKGQGFPDVADNHWAKSYIDKAAAKGFVTGYPDGSFKPDNNITRAEVVAVTNRILSRYPDKKHIDSHIDDINTFIDVTDNSYWAYYHIYEAASNHYSVVDKNNETWIYLQ